MDTTELKRNIICVEAANNRSVVIDRIAPNGFCECTDLLSGAKLTLYRLFLTPMQQIPGRFKQHQFNQVAAHLGAALQEFPKCIRVDPQGYSAETLARKLREGIQAKKQYGWKHSSIDEKLWSEKADLLVVSIDEKTTPITILVGSRDSFKEGATVGVATISKSAAPTGVIHLDKPTPEELEDVCLLLHRKKFVPAPIFMVRDLSEADIASLESRYEVAIMPSETDPKLFSILS